MEHAKDIDKPLSSFGGSGRHWTEEMSPTLEVDSGDCTDSIEFKSTPVLRESIASPAFDVEKENKPYDTISPGMRSDDVPTLVTPNTEGELSPSFDLALPIPPIASLTPDIATPDMEPESCVKKLEEGEAKVKFAERESTPSESTGIDSQNENFLLFLIFFFSKRIWD